MKSSLFKSGNRIAIQNMQAMANHELQHARLPSLLLPPRVCSNSYPLSCDAIFCHSLLLPSVLPSIRVFSNELALCIRWPEYWSFSFSINPSSEYSGLIFFRVDWFDLSAVQGTLKNFSPAPQFKSINSLALSLFHVPTLTPVHDYWKKP